MRTSPLLRILTIALLLSMIGISGAVPVRASERTGQINFIIGQKMLDKNDWEPFEKQFEDGVEMSWGKKSWPIAIATDYLLANDKETISGHDLTVFTHEIAVGVRKIWETGRVHPYVGGGVALLAAELRDVVSGNEVSDSTTGTGGWIGGGIFWRLGRRFNLGFAARYTNGSMRLLGADINAGGTHAGLILGWGWPASK